MKKKKRIIYQLALRTFTPDGTLKAATKLLPHIASIGVDIIYICPFYVQDDDSDKNTWSMRQTASGTGNPKNPYKISDYYNVDPEFGTNEDLKEFIKEAHKNNLLVMIDLVYLHCGRNAVFIKDHPDFVERNPDGSIKVPDRWPFVRLNFESRGLRNYLIWNMKMFLTEYSVDAFRCDVGDDVPLDFWREAFGQLKAIKPDLITLNEGIRPEFIEEVFDMGYAFEWNALMVDIFARGKSASELITFYENEQKIYGDNITKIMRTIDTHDTASDCGADRNEIIMTSGGVEAALVITTTYDGVPLLWNGYEICDDAENNMFSNRFYGRRSAMNWSKAFTDDGVRRKKFIRELHDIFHNSTAIQNGRIEWISNDAPEQLISYYKKYNDKTVAIIVNSKNSHVRAKINLPPDNFESIKSYGVTITEGTVEAEPYGYIIMNIK